MPLPCARVVTSLLIAGLTLAIACAHVPQRFPLPQEYVEIAEVPGIPRARLWGDAPPPWKHDWAGQSRAEMKVRYPGDRPELTTVSVELRAKDIYKKRGKIKGLRTDAMATTEPLQALIAKYMDEEAMEKIAAEQRKGRALNIGTTNLDSMRPVIWRIGVIANSGRPDALRLIRQILLASASVPGAFPPVLIQVEAGGKKYDELHVDGGASSQVFLYPVGIDYDEVLDRLAVPGRPDVYIIRNARVDPMYEPVKNRFLPILGRSIDSLVWTQGLGDLFRIYLQTCRDGLNFNLAYISLSGRKPATRGKGDRPSSLPRRSTATECRLRLLASYSPRLDNVFG